MSPRATGANERLNGANCLKPLVCAGTVIEIVTGVVPEPAAMVCGLIEDVAPVGSPVTVKLTAAGSVEPPAGVTVRPKVAVPPAVTVCEVAVGLLIVKSCPCAAFTVTVTVAVAVV
jgi:hypothetical protein